MRIRETAALGTPLAVGVARVVLGALWLREGIVKYHAHFGAADILLVVGSTESNTRVSDAFRTFAAVVLAGWPGLFGFAVPLLETGLGVALILGILSLPAAFGSVATLMFYWSADQLIAQYPVMVLLSVVVLTWPVAAGRFSATPLVGRILRPPRDTQSG
ncbi:hypothetical protein [Raineyella sp. W15-4]|uniref:hypothetical protein n=1 Tax=Raineyella sp. W15-4 TaxID=3081651 RepID=UPI00295553F2|nr:hypothetical protein [Raineyella sp. W15-4]WOQ16136.1 hypothetical protein R0145_13090 [Raineyella sp. W15-4]